MFAILQGRVSGLVSGLGDIPPARRRRPSKRASGLMAGWSLPMVLVLSVTPTSSFAQGNACSQLKSVVAAAGSGFAKLRGEAQKPGEWKTTLSLDGSRTCAIRKNEEYMEYRCHSAPVNTENEAVALADRMIKDYIRCLDGDRAPDDEGGSWADISRSPDRRALVGKGGAMVFVDVDFNQWVDEAKVEIVKEFSVETRVTK